MAIGPPPTLLVEFLPGAADEGPYWKNDSVLCIVGGRKEELRERCDWPPSLAPLIDTLLGTGLTETATILQRSAAVFTKTEFLRRCLRSLPAKDLKDAISVAAKRPWNSLKDLQLLIPTILQESRSRMKLMTLLMAFMALAAAAFAVPEPEPEANPLADPRGGYGRGGYGRGRHGRGGYGRDSREYSRERYGRKGGYRGRGK
ncbi:unnamed protein product [Cyprideis torosa]|uniref:Uncharacterized protein n=1 Tax=Cyprideis torosa TaxID=163714 RepID=A0A7R8WJD7_9CRUS|nr:unnamed protein product [Cyprideis torosa]CAG0895529.1 unnamed protein product [Cyprideis torosa]